jgi:hypothetical protein
VLGSLTSGATGDWSVAFAVHCFANVRGADQAPGFPDFEMACTFQVYEPFSSASSSVARVVLVTMDARTAPPTAASESWNL